MTGVLVIHMVAMVMLMAVVVMVKLTRQLLSPLQCAKCCICSVPLAFHNKPVKGCAITMLSLFPVHRWTHEPRRPTCAS